MDFGNWQDDMHESLKSDKYTVSKERNEKGCYVVEGDMEEFLKDMHCISLEEANKRLWNLKDKSTEHL